MLENTTRRIHVTQICKILHQTWSSKQFFKLKFHNHTTFFNGKTRSYLVCQNLETFVEWACQCCGLHSQFMPNQGKCIYDSIWKKIVVKSNLGIFELLVVLFMYTSQGWHSQQVWSYINTLHPCWVWFKLQNHTSCTINQLERFSLTKMSILKMNSLS